MQSPVYFCVCDKTTEQNEGWSGAKCSNQGANTLTQQFGRRRAADVLFWLRRFCAVVCADASFALIKNIYCPYETQMLPPKKLITLPVTEKCLSWGITMTCSEIDDIISKRLFLFRRCMNIKKARNILGQVTPINLFPNWANNCLC